VKLIGAEIVGSILAFLPDATPLMDAGGILAGGALVFVQMLWSSAGRIKL